MASAETNYLYFLPVNEKSVGVDGELSTPWLTAITVAEYFWSESELLTWWL